MDKTDEHKHQYDEDQHAEEGMQYPSHLRCTKGFGQPLQSREEQSDTRKRYQKETDYYCPVTGTINELRSQDHFAFTHERFPHHLSLCWAQSLHSGKSAQQR